MMLSTPSATKSEGGGHRHAYLQKVEISELQIMLSEYRAPHNACQGSDGYCKQRRVYILIGRRASEG